MAGICALVFAKYPVAGAVKARMVPPLTFAQAAALHEASLLAVCEKTTRIDDFVVKVVVTPDDRVDDMRAIVGDGVEDCWPQGGGNLGERIERTVDRALGSGVGGVIVLGADSPTMPCALLQTAVRRLADHDAILGACSDGGYYLIGMRRRLAVLFDRIDWGGSDVAAQTHARASEAGVDLEEIPPWYDLDRFEDLQRAWRDLAESDEALGPASSKLRDLVKPWVEGYRHE